MDVAGKADILHFRMMGQTVAERQEVSRAEPVVSGCRIVVGTTLRDGCEFHIIDMRNIEADRP